MSGLIHVGQERLEGTGRHLLWASDPLGSSLVSKRLRPEFPQLQPLGGEFEEVQ